MNSIAIHGYGSSTDFTIDAGVQIICSDVFAIGGAVSNVTGETLGQTREAIPQMLSGGVWYTPLVGLSVGISVEKESLYEPSVRCCTEFTPVESIVLRFGMCDVPASVSGGCAVHVLAFTFEYAFGYHWVLGSTHEVGLSFTIG
jgi:hypothetical protein